MAKDIKVEIVGDASKLKKSLNEAQGATSKFDSEVGSLGKTIAGVFGAAEVANFAKQAVSAASDYNETVSKAKVIFGEAADAAIDFAEGAAESFGLSQQAALDAEATFAIFGKGAGIAGDELVGFSKKMTSLAADMASFSNTSPAEAIEAIGAALRGESEPIRKYGVLLDDATLKHRAMTLGIYKGTGTLTQQQRVLAAQAEILAQTSDAQGDFARTSGGMAGQMKIATAELENMKVQLGQNLIPLVIDAAKNLIWVTKTLGPLIDKANEATESIGGLSTVLDFGLNGPIGWGKALWNMNDAFSSFTPNVRDATEAFEHHGIEVDAAGVALARTTESFEHAGIAGQDAGIAVSNLGIEMGEAAREAGKAQRATDNLRASWDLLKGTLSDQQAWIDVENGFADVKQAGIDAMDAAKHHTADAEQKTRDYQSALIDLRSKVIDYAQEIGGLPLDVTTVLQAQVDNGSISSANQLLDEIAKARTVIYNAQVAGHREYASGTSSATRGLALVGEHGPELMNMHGGERVYPAGQTAAMLNGNGGGITVIQHIAVSGIGINPAQLGLQLVEAIRAANRTYGATL